MTEKNEISAYSMNEQNDTCYSNTSCCGPAPQFPVTRAAPKIGRNDQCPCDSGRKFKKCCGKNTSLFS